MSDSFYVILNSNDSRELYEDNKMANFKVHLAKRLELEGEWECALVRFSFTNSLCTFHAPQSIYLSSERKSKEVEILLAPQRFRDINHLVRVINKTVEDDVNIGEGDLYPYLRVDHNDRVVMVHNFIGKQLFRLEFSPHLEIILGLDRHGCHYLHAFRTDLYVYLDIIAKKIVGDAYVQLLTTVDIGNVIAEQGDQVIYKIKQPEYSRIVQSSIDEVEVQVLDDTGREPVFEFGVVSLTLHLRKKK